MAQLVHIDDETLSLAETILRKLPKYNCRITLDLRNVLTGLSLVVGTRIM